MSESKLPVPVLDGPHWRVNIRPELYDPEAIPSLAACFDLIQATKVSLRGWDYPHLSRRTEQRGQGPNWVASWSDFGRHLEYWRMYQSAQFLHLFSVLEANDPDWKAKLRQYAAGHVSYRTDIDWDKVPGYFSLVNVLYTITEIFEFAARVAQRGVYTGTVAINIALRNVQGFVLTPDFGRAWSEHRVTSEPVIAHEWQLEGRELVAASSQASLAATSWFFERMGWLEPSVEVLRGDQAKFLAGRL